MFSDSNKKGCGYLVMTVVGLVLLWKVLLWVWQGILWLYKFICGVIMGTPLSVIALILVVTLVCLIVMWRRVLRFLLPYSPVLVVVSIIYASARPEVFTAQMPWFAFFPALPAHWHTLLSAVLAYVIFDAIFIWSWYFLSHHDDEEKKSCFKRACLHAYVQAIILIDIFLTPAVYSWLSDSKGDGRELAAWIISEPEVIVEPEDNTNSESDEGENPASPVPDEDDLMARAKRGNAIAQNALGNCYRRGHGRQQNDEEAFKWYQKSADQGYPEAEKNLGWCYMKGRGVEANMGNSVFWFRSAANHGSAEAQYHLACIYKSGLGVPVDFEAARTYAKKSMDNGYKDAQKLLAEIEADAAKKASPSGATPGTASGDQASPREGIAEAARRHLERIRNMPVSGKSGRNHRQKLVELLGKIAEGSPIDTRDSAKRTTALHHACGLGDVELIQWLVQEGADPVIEDRTGTPPSEYTAKKAIREWLKKQKKNGKVAPKPQGFDSQELEKKASELAALYVSETPPGILADKIVYNGVVKSRDDFLAADREYNAQFSASSVKPTGCRVTSKGNNQITVLQNFRFVRERKRDGKRMIGTGSVMITMEVIQGKLFITGIKE